MTFFRQILNLWRIRCRPTPYDKGVLRHLSVNPHNRRDVKEWQIGRTITRSEADR